MLYMLASFLIARTNYPIPQIKGREVDMAQSFRGFSPCLTNCKVEISRWNGMRKLKSWQ